METPNRLVSGDYYRQLDSLRAFAVAAVAWHHWAPQWSFGLPFAAGVQLFFVLSGYLITAILLKAKLRNEQHGRESKGFILRHFYVRRALRIFPLYYGVLSAALLLNISDLQGNWPWHYAYLSNYYFIAIQGWQGAVAHFWSLAVEEQFYMLWPWLLLLLPSRLLPGVFCAFVASAPLFRLVARYFFPETDFLFLATPASFDSLALGALLAYHEQRPLPLFTRIGRHYRSLAAGLVVAYLAVAYTGVLPRGFRVLELTLLSAVFAILIWRCRSGIGGAVGAVLNQRWLIYTGKISYGLYVLHSFAYWPTQMVLNRLPESWSTPLAYILLNAFWTFLGAALSWHLYEAPINSLKKNFPYNRRPADPSALPATA